jgi:hypothetical protein
MWARAKDGRLIRFGVFELDLEAGELRRNGQKVRLQEQPFRVLNLLLERPGEVVARDELRRTLWPDGTFVDFDHGLHTAINKLREALGDLPRAQGTWKPCRNGAIASLRPWSECGTIHCRLRRPRSPVAYRSNEFLLQL